MAAIRSRTDSRWTGLSSSMRRGSLVDNLKLIDLMGGPRARRGSIFSSAPEGQTGLDPIQSRRIILLKLFGAMLFILGSVVFAYEPFGTHWLHYARIGSVVWLPGCLAYLAALWVSIVYANAASLSGKISDVLQITSMFIFVAGSAFYFHGEEQNVLGRLYLINRLFLVGSVLLIVDALKTSCSASLTEGLAVDNVFELAASSFFVVAAILGGGYYKASRLVINGGILCWSAGSTLCLIPPMCTLYRQVQIKVPSQPRAADRLTKSRTSSFAPDAPAADNQLPESRAGYGSVAK